MIAFSILLFVCAAAAALMNWRLGFTLSILAAMLEGPLRKLAPDQPIYFTVAAGAMFGVTTLGALARGVSLDPARLPRWAETVGAPYLVYVALVCLQAAHSLLLYLNVPLTVLGLVTYLAPIPAFVLGYQYAIRQGISGVLGFLHVYVLVAAAVSATVYLEALGFEHPILGQVGDALVISDAAGSFNALAGLYRASEIAAWHTATCACLFVALATVRRITAGRLFQILVFVLFMVGICVLTGRRKSIIQIVVFACIYVALAAWYTREGVRLAAVAAATALVAFLALTQLGSEAESIGERSVSYQLYLERSKSSFSEVPERVVQLGLAPIDWAMNRFGPLGGGLGIASQGARFFTGGVQLSGGAGEGGLGKIVLELGLPGLAAIAWLTWAMGRYVIGVLGETVRRSIAMAKLAFALTAILVSNIAAFTVATQAFGDLFVLSLLAILSGFLFAIPVLAQLESATAAGMRVLHGGEAEMPTPTGAATVEK